MSRTISAGESPKLRVETIGGDVSIVGWDGGEILIKGDDEDIRLEHQGEDVVLSGGGDLSLRVPKAASVQIRQIGGDAAIRGVGGEIQLGVVGGDLSIRDAGPISIEAIQADFSLRGARGDVHVKHAAGDVSIRDVDGNIQLEAVADDLALRGARGDVKVNVGADAILYLDPKEEYSYSITAGDDLLLVLLPSANATLSIRGDEIDIDWPGVQNADDETERTIVLGDGSAQLRLSAGGDVRVTNRADAGESAEEFGNFAGLNFDWSGFGDLISRQVEQATSRAAKRAHEAARRAERHAERHARRWMGGAGRWNFNPQNMPPPPRPPSEPVSEDERLTILRMLQEKKITAQQAEELLGALEDDK